MTTPAGWPDFKAWSLLQRALDDGLLPDDATLGRLSLAPDSFAYGREVEDLTWPEEPLRPVLIRESDPVVPAVLATVIDCLEHALLICPTAKSSREGRLGVPALAKPVV